MDRSPSTVPPRDALVAPPRGERSVAGRASESAEVPERSRAVLLTGAYGSGKSTVAAEIAGVLERAGVAFALLDLDHLNWANPPGVDVHDDLRLLLANLTSVTRTYAEAGIDTFVLAGFVEARSELDAIGAALAMPLRVVRLEVPWAEIERRLRADVTSARADDLREAARQISATPAPLGELTVRNDRPVADTAEEILRRLGWMFPPVTDPAPPAG